MGQSKKAAVAFFVLLGTIVFGIGLFLIGDRRRLFEESFQVTAEFFTLAGLSEGAAVRIAGVEAGEVLEIRYPEGPQSPFRVRMRIIEELHPLVRQNSEATIRTDGLLGNKFVHIHAGTESSPPVADGGEIPGREPFEIADVLDRASEAIDTFEDAFKDVRSNAQTAIASVQSTFEQADELMETVGDDLEAMSAAASAITQDAQLIVADVRAGRGTIGKLVTDDAIYRHAQNTAEQLDAMSEDVSVLVGNLKSLSETATDAFAELDSTDGTVPGLVGDVQQTIAAAHEAMTDMAESMESMKRGFLFRSMFLERGFFDIDAISQKEYLEGALTRVGHRTLRFWIDADELVMVGDDGEERLTDVGRAAVDAAMVRILQFPMRTPLMVEGYSSAGSLERQFLTARRRARLVRDYIVSRFHRDPNYTGFIPLESRSPGIEASDGSEEGVVLSLYYEAGEENSPRHRMVP